MTVTQCLEHWGTPEFEDRFLTELTEHDDKLPLEDMCQSGGYPSPYDCAELEELKIESESNGVVKGSFHVSFTEESPTGCRDIQWSDRRSGRIDFSLRLETGELEFAPPRLEREYEPEEF